MLADGVIVGGVVAVGVIVGGVVATGVFVGGEVADRVFAGRLGADGVQEEKRIKKNTSQIAEKPLVCFFIFYPSFVCVGWSQISTVGWISPGSHRIS
jgi:hypothetical protein